MPKEGFLRFQKNKISLGDNVPRVPYQDHINSIPPTTNTCPIDRVWKGVCMICVLTEKQSMNQENSRKTAVICQLYIQCDVWSSKVVAVNCNFYWYTVMELTSNNPTQIHVNCLSRCFKIALVSLLRNMKQLPVKRMSKVTNLLRGNGPRSNERLCGSWQSDRPTQNMQQEICH